MFAVFSLVRRPVLGLALLLSLTASTRAGTFDSPLELRDASGAKLAVQVEGEGRATFLSPAVAPGQKHSWELTPASAGESEKAVGWEAKEEGSLLRFSRKGQPVLSYQMQPGALPPGVPAEFSHGAYLHPIYSPSGNQVLLGTPPEGFSLTSLQLQVADAGLTKFTTVATDAHMPIAIGGEEWRAEATQRKQQGEQARHPLDSERREQMTFHLISSAQGVRRAGFSNYFVPYLNAIPQHSLINNRLC